MLRVTALLHCLLLLLFVGGSSIAIATEDPTTLETALRDVIEETEEPMNSSLNPTFLSSVNSTTSTSIEQPTETSSSNFQGRSVTPVNGDSQHEVLAGLQSPQQNTDNNQSSLLPTIFKQKYIFGSDLLPMQIGKEGELKKMKDSYVTQQELAKTSSPELFKAYKSACAILDIAESYQTKALLKVLEKYQELSTKEQSITKSVFFLRDLHCSDGQGEILNRNITKLLSAANSVVELTKEGIRVDQLIASARAADHMLGREGSIHELETAMQQKRNAIEAYKAFANAVKADDIREARKQFKYGSALKHWTYNKKISFLKAEAATLRKYCKRLITQATTVGNTLQAESFKLTGRYAYTVEFYLQKALTARAAGNEKIAQTFELSAQCWIGATWARTEGTEAGLARAENFQEAANPASAAGIIFGEALKARAAGNEQVAQACELCAECYIKASQILARKASEHFSTVKDIREFFDNWEFTTTRNCKKAVELVQAGGSHDQIQALLQAAQYRILATEAYIQRDEKNLLKAKELKQGAIIAHKAATIFGEAYNLSQQSNNSNASQVKSLTDKAKDMIEEARAYAEQEKEIEDE